MNQHEEDRVDDDEREDERLHASHDRPPPPGRSAVSALITMLNEHHGGIE